MAAVAPGKPKLKRSIMGALGAVRLKSLAPVLVAMEPITTRLDAIDRRLEAVERWIADIDTLLVAMSGRASTLAEQYGGLLESEARLARRVEEIERMLGAPASQR